MKDKYLKLLESLTEEEADKLSELFFLLLNNYSEEKINLYSEIKNFDIMIIYKVLNLFSDEQTI